MPQKYHLSLNCPFIVPEAIVCVCVASLCLSLCCVFVCERESEHWCVQVCECVCVVHVCVGMN